MQLTCGAGATPDGDIALSSMAGRSVSPLACVLAPDRPTPLDEGSRGDRAVVVSGRSAERRRTAFCSGGPVGRDPIDVLGQGRSKARVLAKVALEQSVVEAGDALHRHSRCGRHVDDVRQVLLLLL